MSWTFYLLAQRLQSFGLLDHLDEISHNIYVYLPSNGIEHLTSIEVSQWIQQLKLLDSIAKQTIVNVLLQEMIDGFAFHRLNEYQWIHVLGLNANEYFLLGFIRDGWAGAWGDPIAIPPNSCGAVECKLATDLRSCSTSLAHQLHAIDDTCSNYGIGVMYGQLVVLGSKEYHTYHDSWQAVGPTNEKLILRRRSVANGESFVGQLLGDSVISRNNVMQGCDQVIGHVDDMDNFAKIISENANVGVGPQHHITIASSIIRSYPFESVYASCAGVTLPSTTYSSYLHASHYECTESGDSESISDLVQSVTMLGIPDPRYDIFQLGRSEELLVNDLICKGPVHDDNSGISCGTVSRVACRIVCERLPPFRCFVFAGGFTHAKNLHLGADAPRWIEDMSTSSSVHEDSPVLSASTDDATMLSQRCPADGFSTYGVRLWSPVTKTWTEITVMGRACNLRTNKQDMTDFLSPSIHTNELVDGSILDLCGVSLLFQNPVTMARQMAVAPVSPSEVINELNSLRPHCPVLMHAIKFSYLSTRERAIRASRRLESLGVTYAPRGPFHIPAADYSDVHEEHRSYVFPACGHVHAFHPSLQGRPCPLCRKVGEFVPIAFAFEPAICHKKPTHVFNPCGHVASKEVCERWSTQPLLCMTPFSTATRSCCPYCMTTLVEPTSKCGPFTRLIVQTESGLDWTEDEAPMETSLSQNAPSQSWLTSETQPNCLSWSSSYKYAPLVEKSAEGPVDESEVIQQGKEHQQSSPASLQHTLFMTDGTLYSLPYIEACQKLHQSELRRIQQTDVTQHGFHPVWTYNSTHHSRKLKFPKYSPQLQRQTTSKAGKSASTRLCL